MEETINHSKGQVVDLKQNLRGESTFDLSLVTFGIGFGMSQNQNFLKKIFSSKEDQMDIDAFAFLLDHYGKVADPGRTIETSSGKTIRNYNKDVIYFNSVKHPSGNIWLTGDSIAGTKNGDKEQIVARLEDLEEKYQRIVFGFSIFQGRESNRDLSSLQNCYLRAMDARGNEITRMYLSGGKSLEGNYSVVFCEAFRKNESWKIQAIEQSYPTDDFMDLLSQYT